MSICIGIEDISKWILVHDGDKVLFKGQTASIITHKTLLSFATEGLMEAEIVSLGLIDKPDEV